MNVRDLKIGMKVRVNDTEHTGFLTVSQIRLRSGEYEVELWDEVNNCFLNCVVEKIISCDPVSSNLTWQDIRDIVRLADSALEYHSKKDLVNMGERGYYEDVLKAYECQVMDKASCCAGTNVPIG